jgi:nucleotide-binding universal stress UspA family protein
VGVIGDMPRAKQEFSKILLAIDGSESSMAAADYAISITACYDGADLIVLHVLPAGIKKVYFDYKPEDLPIWISTNLSEYKHEVQRWLYRINDKYQKQNQREQHKNETANVTLKIDIVDLLTSVAGTIVSYAEEQGIDLIVIGTRGTSGIKRMLLGSVAEGVVMYTHCPVLVVK